MQSRRDGSDAARSRVWASRLAARRRARRRGSIAGSYGQGAGELLEVRDEVRPHQRLVTRARVGGHHGGELVELRGALVVAVVEDSIREVRVGGTASGGHVADASAAPSARASSPGFEAASAGTSRRRPFGRSAPRRPLPRARHVACGCEVLHRSRLQRLHLRPARPEERPGQLEFVLAWSGRTTGAGARTRRASRPAAGSPSWPSAGMIRVAWCGHTKSSSARKSFGCCGAGVPVRMSRRTAR